MWEKLLFQRCAEKTQTSSSLGGQFVKFSCKEDFSIVRAFNTVSVCASHRAHPVTAGFLGEIL